ncbi:MAG: glycoside hydrolase family 15 protein [Anaerolineae bacterium]
MTDLFQRSIEVILSNQAPTGAYLASPNFPSYRYSWFRDGAFIAYAMDLAGQHESAQRFHDWAARTVLRHADKAQRAIEKAQRGEPLVDDYLHTRYTVGGEEAGDEWPNFQLDGFGTWLWALAEHDRRQRTAHRCSGLPAHWQQAVDLVVRYLAALWLHPCYDLWEEHPQYLHPYTLAAIYAGLKAADSMEAAVGGSFGFAQDRRSSAVVEEIRRFVLERGVRDGRLVKHITPPSGIAAVGGPFGRAQGRPRSTVVDASLLGVATPYRLLAPGDPIMRATVARIEADLRRKGGGVHRYRGDTYYGGGEWVLLTAWLGWYYADLEEHERAQELLAWIEAQADERGDLPEQVPHTLNAPSMYQPWVNHRGTIAKPLLWSHAAYLILRRHLGDQRPP